MKLVVYFIMSIIILPIVIRAHEFLTSSVDEVNLTHWREYRRKKRFILFENAGILKLVTGITYPVDLGDSKPWRQLVVTYNLQYQFPVPSRPIYWFNKWNRRNFRDRHPFFNTPEMLENYKDVAQELIYKFAENLMERKGMDGRACLQRMICENAQIHTNQGLYAEILHRILQPQRNLNSDYTEAWNFGKKLLNCRTVYFNAKRCLLDDYIHVRKDFMSQHFVKDIKM